MKFAVSSLGFLGPTAPQLNRLDRSMGIEIFYEWGGETYWELILETVMEGRTGGFSIHSPYMNLDLSLPGNDKWLERCLTEPFELYHRFGGEAYVVHPNGPLLTPPDERAEAERRKLAAERLNRLNALCRREGVTMLVENLGFGRGVRTLFNFDQYMQLFLDDGELLSLYDTGHGNLERFDVEKLQRTLNGRLRGYHLHDNRGAIDDHHRMFRDQIDWNAFAKGAARYTPDAAFVMEYNRDAVDDIENYREDADTLKRLMALE